MTTTTGQAQHTIRQVLDEKRQQPGVLLPMLHDIQLALPWLAADVPEAMAGIAAYLQCCSDPRLRRDLQLRLEQGEDAGLQALVCDAFRHLRALQG